MIAVDTNILIYANRADLPEHNRAKDALSELVSSGAPWALPWPCVHKILAVASSPRVFRNPLLMAEAVAYCAALRDDAGARFLSERGQHLETLDRIAAGISGPRIHDARIAAICLDHGVAELWTADRDFSYFPALLTRNPMAG